MAKFLVSLDEHMIKSDYVVLDVRHMRVGQKASVLNHLEVRHAGWSERVLIVE